MAKDKEIDLSGFDEEIQKDVDLSTFDKAESNSLPGVSVEGLPGVPNNAEPTEREFKLNELIYGPETLRADLPESINRYLGETITALARGGVEGVTLGFADEIGAALSTGSISSPEYQQKRDELRRRYQEIKAASPKAAMVGELGGAVAIGMVPGLAPVANAGLAARIGTGALVGGLAGAGASEADLAKDINEGTTTYLGEFALDAGKGGAVGGTLSAAFPALFNKDVMSKATKKALNPKTGELIDVMDWGKLGKQTARAAGVGATAGGAAGALMAEDPYEGALAGALLGGTAGLAARGTVGTARAFAGTKFGDRLTRSYKLGQSGETLNPSRVAKELNDVTEDIHRLISTEIDEKAGKSALDEVDRVADRIKNFINRNKNIKGQKIGEIISELRASGQQMDVTEFADMLIQKLDNDIRLDPATQAPVRRLREQLVKLKEMPGKDIKTSVTSRSTTIKPEQTSMFDEGVEVIGGSKTYKVGGKDVTVEELRALVDQADSTRPGKASITQTVSPDETSINRSVTQENILSQAPKTRNDVTFEEVLKLKETLAKGQEISDPSQRQFFQRAYGDFIEELQGRIKDPKTSELYRGLRKDYANLLRLEDAALTENIQGAVVPGRSTQKAIESFGQPGVNRSDEPLNELLDLIQKVEGRSEVSDKLRGQAATAAERLRTLKAASDPLKDPLAIAKQVPAAADPLIFGNTELNRTMKVLRDLAPEKQSSIQNRISGVANKLDLIGETERVSNLGNFTPRGLVGYGLGSVPQATIRGANKLGYLLQKPEALNSIASAAQQRGFKTLSSKLRNALSKEGTYRAAAIYTILNDPAARQQLNELDLSGFDIDSEETE